MNTLNRRFGGEKRSAVVARFRFILLGGVLAAAVVSGCAHTPGRVAQFDPVPREEMDVNELESCIPKAVSDLLRQADDELQQANAAQEKGNKEEAFQHYQRMFALLQEAELDPALNYASRKLFSEILSSHMRHAHLYHRQGHPLGQAGSGVYSNLVIPTPLPQPVLAEIEELQQSYSPTFQRGLNRSSAYLPHIKQVFREAGLPEDLAWLAMVESMFQQKVVSPAGAGGMWQFMPTTARRYDLRMDSYVDERYNWHSATCAAIQYLKNLHDFFDGDWSLAVTAYNMGEGGLSRAISANGGNGDFWTLINTPPASDRIKQESKKYYPRLLAYIIVANAPEQYGFTLTPEPVQDTERIPVKGSYYLADLEQALGVSKGVLAALNPDLLREMTPSQGEYAVAVPRDKKDQFLAALTTVNSVKPAGTHRIRRGESLLEIARRYGVDEKELMRVNSIKSSRSIKANQVLQLPDPSAGRGGSEEPEAAPEPQLAKAEPEKKEAPAEKKEKEDSGADKIKEKTYTVKRGDTLGKIADANKVSMAQLQKWNKLPANKTILAGQVLKVGEAKEGSKTKEAGKSAETPEPGERMHTVKPGEYPSIIAELYGVRLADLFAWNNLTDRSVIRAGDKLVVAGKAAPAESDQKTAKKADEEKKTPEQEPRETTTVTHKVNRGEAASAIAEKYGVRLADLLEWNDLTAKSILRVGQNLTVKKANTGTSERDRKADMKVSQAPQDKKMVHKVTSGQNPSIIARTYGVSVNDLFKWNNWSERHVLRVGDEVSIYK